MDNTAIPEITRVRIDDVIVGDRIRREFKEEELASLTESIKTDGLLQPIVINQDNKLIAGHRRYTCCREIGYETIDARRVSTKGDLHEALLEIRENVIREDFTFSEKMRAAEAIEPIIAEKAEERKSNKEASDLSEFGIDLGKGKTRDIVAEILKIGSGKTYDNAKKVWASKNEDLIQRLDNIANTRTGSLPASP